MIKNLLVVAAVVVMSGCTAMDKLAGLGVVSEHGSSFDNATVVEVSPNSLYSTDSAWGTPLQLGARWSSATPDDVALVLAYSSNVSSGNPAYLGLSGFELNIDGEISSHAAGQPTDLGSSGYNTVSRTVYTSSTNAVFVPYALLQRMVAAKDCRLRVHTSKGYQDIDFSTAHIPGGKATAIVSIREFMAKVDAARGKG